MTDWKDPQIRAIREIMAGMARSVDEPEPSVQELRGPMDAMGAATPPPEGCRVEAMTLGGRPAERLTPRDAVAGRVILFLHGGGYCIGSLASHRALAARLAEATRCAAVVPDYRLAPEHPFPAAVDDALAAWRDLLASGADPARAAIAGDSAGGGLTFATALAAREAGLPMPAALLAISPWADLAQTGASYAAKAQSDTMITKAGLDLFSSTYLAGTDPRHPLASPLFADLTGLPPTLIQVGGEESLLSDSAGMAQALGLAGVDVTLRIWPEMIHVWHFFAPRLTAGQAATDEAGAWLRGRLA